MIRAQGNAKMSQGRNLWLIFEQYCLAEVHIKIVLFFKSYFCFEVFFVCYLPASEASQVKKYFLEDIFASVTQMPGARVGIPVLVPVQTP